MSGYPDNPKGSGNVTVTCVERIAFVSSNVGVLFKVTFTLERAR
jgi:hypothetical protein